MLPNVAVACVRLNHNHPIMMGAQFKNHREGTILPIQLLITTMMADMRGVWEMKYKQEMSRDSF